MDAITLLKADHKTVKGLFRDFKRAGTTKSRKATLVRHMSRELSVHAAIEEKLFYPAVRKAVPAVEAEVLEGLEEHHIVKWTLSELEGLDPDDERFEPKVTVLIESVRHHIEEEEGELFPAVRAALGRSYLLDLGERMAQAKQGASRRPHPRSPDSPPGNLGATKPAVSRSVRTSA